MSITMIKSVFEVLTARFLRVLIGYLETKSGHDPNNKLSGIEVS
jgi:hypothetical protein